MGHADRPEEDKGYEGCSESDGGSDVDQPGHSQVQLLSCTCCCFSCYFICFITYVVRLENMLGRKAVQENLMAERPKALANFLLLQT